VQVVHNPERAAQNNDDDQGGDGNGQQIPALLGSSAQVQEAAVQVVASGIGVACLSRLVVADSLRSRRLLALRAPYLDEPPR